VPDQFTPPRLNIGIIGTGVAGMSAAWLLSKSHDVTVFEKDDRIGGHTNTVDLDGLGVDTGFIVYNVANYPNLIALFDHLGVETRESDMSFGVSVDQGNFEYSGGDLSGLLAQKKNLMRPRFWTMLRDILRFYRNAPNAIRDDGDDGLTLGQYLSDNGYSKTFQRDHLLPMGAAIWSTPVDTMLEYPLSSFLRFCENHGLLQISNRPQWRTVVGGSREYVKKLTASYQDKIVTNSAVTKVKSDVSGAYVEVRSGAVHCFDHVVMASHADQSIQMLGDADPAERKLLEAFNYQPNKAILHTDPSLMPQTRKAWSSWNYLSENQDGEDSVCITYWMNRLQNLQTETDYFVTLNPTHMPTQGTILRSFLYYHPIFDRDSIAAQRMLWNIQGQRRLWFCGSYFGHGFHEDALQSGLAVAEALGGMRRPWQVENESGRIYLPQDLLRLTPRDQDAA